jgi:hypothetical protein
VRLGQARAHQSELFGEIVIESVAPGEGAPAAAAPAINDVPIPGESA